MKLKLQNCQFLQTWYSVAVLAVRNSIWFAWRHVIR